MNLLNFVSESDFPIDIHDFINFLSLAIEVLAVLFIVYAVFFNFARYIFHRLKKHSKEQTYTEFRHALARALLLGMEMLIAADIARTVALDTSAESIAVLGLLILIRTFLSWSLVVEIEGRWPWNMKSEEL